MKKRGELVFLSNKSCILRNANLMKKINKDSNDNNNFC